MGHSRCVTLRKHAFECPTRCTMHNIVSDPSSVFLFLESFHYCKVRTYNDESYFKGVPLEVVLLFTLITEGCISIQQLKPFRTQHNGNF